MTLTRIRPPARRTIFEAMVAMAWADARIEREEVLAVQAAGRVLGLGEDVLDVLDAGAPAVGALRIAGGVVARKRRASSRRTPATSSSSSRAVRSSARSASSPGCSSASTHASHAAQR